MKPLDVEKSQFVRLLRKMEQPQNGNPRSRKKHIATTLKALRAQGVRHYTIPASTARQMMGRAVMAGDREADLSWPTIQPVYIEYDRPVKLDDIPQRRGKNDFVNGIFIAPRPNGYTAYILGTHGAEVIISPTTIYPETGQVDVSPAITEPYRDVEAATTRRFLCRMAHYVRQNIDKER